MTEIFLEEKPPDPISLDDQLCSAQASQGECVAGEGCHPVDLSSFCLVRLFSIMVYFSGLRSSLVEVPGVSSLHAFLSASADTTNTTVQK